MTPDLSYDNYRREEKRGEDIKWDGDAYPKKERPCYTSRSCDRYHTQQYVHVCKTLVGLAGLFNSQVCVARCGVTCGRAV